MSQKDQKTAQIIQAATQEFLLKGVEAASMHRIAERAEVSKRTLYKYYASKDALYIALIDVLLDRIDGMYQIEYARDIPLAEQIEKIIDKKMKLTFSTSFLNMSKIIMGEMLRDHIPSKTQLEKMYVSEARFVDWIEAAKKDGKIKEHPSSHVMADQFHAIMKSQIFWPVLFGFVQVKDIDATEVKGLVLAFFLSSFCNHQ